MRKKYLSALLFGALLFASAGTFTSCKDYDDDINNLQTQITANADAIKKLQDMVGEGKWVTSVVGIENGIKVTMNDGTSTDILGMNGEDGKDGVDGQDGTVVTIIDGYWAFDGVKSEYPATPGSASEAHEIKISEDGYWEIWNTETGAYEKTPYAVAPISAAQNTNGSWTITIKNADGTTDSINIPATALASIEVDEPQGYNDYSASKDMTYWYGVVNEDVKWGWDGEETMEAGFYSKLDKDVRVLLNPAGVHGDSYNYTLKNSAGVEADVTFFKTAEPYTGAALTRATSANGLWVLPAEVTKKPAADIEQLRRELYLSFKVNDGEAYRLALEASDEQGNTVRTEYDNTVTLEEADAKKNDWFSIESEYYCLIGETYYPEILKQWYKGGQVYKYKLRLNQDPTNLRRAEVYGATVTEDGQGYVATKEAGVYNPIRYDICGVFINGETFVRENAISVYFTNEMTTDQSWEVNAINTALDANVVDRTKLDSYINSQLESTDKVFVYTYTYDLSEKVAALSDTEKLVWDQAIRQGTIFSMRNDWERYPNGLIGGEGEYNSTNLNWLMNRHMTWSINPRNAKENPNQLTVNFYVSDSWDGWTNDEATIEAANFKLNTAYQLTLYVADPENRTKNVTEIVLPFEFKQPTLDIKHVDGKFTTWSTVKWTDDNTYPALNVYGHLCNADDNMQLPLYDSFTAWKAKDGDKVTGDYQQYVDNAEYYDITFDVPANSQVMGMTGNNQTAQLDNDLNYAAVDHNLNTFIDWTELNNVATPDNKILPIYMDVDYKFYGVYDSNVEDFVLFPSSWLASSKLDTKSDTYTTERGTHKVMLTNDDIDFTTPKGGAYYLFDDLDGINAAPRAEINGDTFNEINHYPFTGFSDQAVSYQGHNITGLFDATDNHFSAVEVGDMTTPVAVEPHVLTNADFTVESTTGNRMIKDASIQPDASKIKVYLVPSWSERRATSADNVATNITKINAFRGGMLVVLPQNYNEQDGAVITVTLKDVWGYTNSFKFTVTKL